MKKRFVSICTLIVLGFGLGIAVSEILVRTFVPLSDFLWEFDPAIGMKLIPGKRGRAVKQGIYDVAAEVNSAGFRDVEHSIDKKPGVRRIALLGDSVVEALQVPFEKSITPLIEQGLQKAGIRSEAINFGVSGAGTAREYLALRDYALKYQPDLVLLFFSGNDFGDNTRELKGLSYLPYPKTSEDGSLILDQEGRPVFLPFADQQSRFAFLTEALRDHLKTYRLLRETMDTMPSLKELWDSFYRTKPSTAAVDESKADFGLYEIYRTDPKPLWAKGRRTTEGLLLAMRDLAAERGVEFAVVPVPAAWEVYPERWEEVLNQVPGMRGAEVDIDLPSRNLKQFLDEHHVCMINLLSDFRKHSAGTSLYLSGDAHWTPLGHQLTASLVSDQVAKILSVDETNVCR